MGVPSANQVFGAQNVKWGGGDTSGSEKHFWVVACSLVTEPTVLVGGTQWARISVFRASRGPVK